MGVVATNKERIESLQFENQDLREKVDYYQHIENKRLRERVAYLEHCKDVVQLPGHSATGGKRPMHSATGGKRPMHSVGKEPRHYPAGRR